MAVTGTITGASAPQFEALFWGIAQLQARTSSIAAVLDLIAQADEAPRLVSAISGVQALVEGLESEIDDLSALLTRRATPTPS